MLFCMRRAFTCAMDTQIPTFQTLISPRIKNIKFTERIVEFTSIYLNLSMERKYYEAFI